MHEHIRERKEIPNDVKFFTFQFCYVKAHKCHWHCTFAMSKHTCVISWLAGNSGEMVIYAFLLAFLLGFYSWTLTTISNWTCSVLTISPFNARLPSTWLTNCADPSTRLQSPIREGCWLQSSSIHPHNKDQEDAWSQNSMVHKHSNFFRRDELRVKLCLWSQFAWTNYFQSLCNLCTFWRPLKKSFYMSRVRRKEVPKIHLRIPRKQIKISVSFLNLDK